MGSIPVTLRRSPRGNRLLWVRAVVSARRNEEVRPAEDEKAFEGAGQDARAQVFDGPVNLERERAIVRHLMADAVSVVMLGGDHDLLTVVPPKVEYLR